MDPQKSYLTPEGPYGSKLRTIGLDSLKKKGNLKVLISPVKPMLAWEMDVKWWGVYITVKLTEANEWRSLFFFLCIEDQIHSKVWIFKLLELVIQSLMMITHTVIGSEMWSVSKAPKIWVEAWKRFEQTCWVCTLQVNFVLALKHWVVGVGLNECFNLIFLQLSISWVWILPRLTLPFIILMSRK